MSDNFKKTDEAKYPKTEVVFLPFEKQVPNKNGPGVVTVNLSILLREEIEARRNMRVVQMHDLHYGSGPRVGTSALHPRGLIVVFEEITTEMRDIESHIKSNSVRLEKKIDALKTELESIKETIKSIYNII